MEARFCSKLQFRLEVKIIGCKLPKLTQFQVFKNFSIFSPKSAVREPENSKKASFREKYRFFSVNSNTGQVTASLIAKILRHNRSL